MALVENSFGRNYELFESYITRNVLLIPDDFVMEHRLAVPPSETTISEDELKLLFNELRAVHFLI